MLYNLISALLKVILFSPVTVGTLVWLLPSVDLPVSVEAAGVGQQLPALLALDGRLPIGADHVGPAERKLLAMQWYDDWG